MNRIRIVACPPGEAPQSVRKAWIGLELPVAPGRLRGLRMFFIGGVLSGPRKWWQILVRILLGQSERQAGYAVNALEAVNMLAAREPLAAKWWREHCPHMLDGKRHFVFAAHVCEECKDTP